MENNQFDNTPLVPMSESGNKKGVIFIILAIIVVAAIAYLLYGSKLTAPAVNENATPDNTAANPPVTATTQLNSTELQIQKADILQKVSGNTPLTSEEKQRIFQIISGDQNEQYNFTTDEMNKIVEALNK